MVLIPTLIAMYLHTIHLLQVNDHAGNGLTLFAILYTRIFFSLAYRNRMVSLIRVPL
jgi:hypothetical protein